MAWVAQRIAISLVLIWIVTTIVFMAIHLVPGDPAEALLTQGGMAADPALIHQLRVDLGLDRPILVQYAGQLGGMLTGDLGQSMMDGAPVTGLIAQRLGRTLELIAAAAVLAVVFGLPSGTAAALRQGGWFDRLASGIAAVSMAMPVFVIGTLLIMLFAQQLRLMPAGGYVPFLQDPAQHVILLAMPAITIGVGLIAIVFRMTRAAVLDVMTRDYVRTARAKGVSRRRVLTRHVIRNALMPVVTVLALHLGTLLGGTVLVEFVFNWPGLSGLLVDAVNARDYPVVIGVVLTVSILFILLNLSVELLYGVLDPRSRQT
ncbi:ABC transporter permease [Marinivivus vitaminiproducens]|uniref:ABC transporter permease n=1 Tax=Marinivivus vitaminiproducens TaxID=3035935 RepID=UPI0027A03B48|nr:ABC transporter permease [Geminicoccaceae bacterium SCSIO 64248]